MRTANRIGYRPWLAVLIATCLSGLLPAQTQRLHVLDAIEPQAQLTTITPTGWQFSTPSANSIVATSVVRWGAWPGIVNRPAAWLSDGSWLSGTLTIGQGQSLAIENDWLRVPGIELSNLRGMVLSPPATLRKWIELEQQMRAAEGVQDVVWLRSHQRVSGVIRWPAAVEGEAIDRFSLDTGSQTTDIKLLDVQAIVFSPALIGPLPTANATAIGLSDGSLLRASKLAVRPASIEVGLSSGLVLESLDEPREIAAAITYVAENPAAASFLSDMQPANYRSLSDNLLKWELGVNHDLYGRPLALVEGSVARGLAMHSSSQVAFRWDQSAGRLLAEVVLAPPDPQAEAQLGSVDCQLLLARGGQLQSVAQFSLTRAKQAAAAAANQLIDVDISGAQLIVLVVEKSDFGQYGDQVFWLDARAVRQ